MDFPYRTYKDYKCISEEFLKKYPKLLNKIPINIELLIEKSGHVLEIQSNLYENFGVKGIVTKNIKKSGVYKIIIDQDHYEVQEFSYKFTLAEELAHILLHSELYKNVNTLDEFISQYQTISEEDYKIFEQQAKALASRLLLPQFLFEKYVFEYIEKHLSLIRRQKFYAKIDLCDWLAEKMARELKLSKFVISKTLLGRYPDIIVDKVLDKFGSNLIK